MRPAHFMPKIKYNNRGTRRGWVIFKNEMAHLLETHLRRNYTKDGSFKFPKYLAVCKCGYTYDTNIRDWIFEMGNFSMHKFNEAGHEVQIYIREDRVGGYK